MAATAVRQVVIYQIKDKKSGHILSLRSTLQGANGRKEQLDQERDREHEVIEQELVQP